jgi:hypothetical protein
MNIELTDEQQTEINKITSMDEYKWNWDLICIDKLNSLLAGLEARADCGIYNEPMKEHEREMLGLINESIKSIKETIDGIHEATQTEQWLL